MRFHSSLILIAALASAAQAQRLASPATLLEALPNLMQAPGLAITLNGSERFGSKTQTIQSNLYYVPGTERQPAKLEIRSYRDGKLEFWVVGDGAYATTFDPKLKQYASAPYRNLDELLQSLRPRVGGPAQHPLRLLGDAARPSDWKSWLPTGRKSEYADAFELTLGEAAHTGFAFWFAFDDLGNPSLTKVTHWKEAGSQSTGWTMKVYPRWEPVDVNFKFVAPDGAVPVAVPRSGKVGG